ncbi:PAS domain-containing protein [Erythrobacter sp. 3-20A1M]|uniref:PAS domain-containing protein n=1 Tax=Erythrobacter sp. 3-20A1M TaxID=2653850 RepID=UPI001BFC076D|nr:PAS domain-containing protein [Erythrobacter sp. 3-20A1M]QWC56327.1 PAS domain-containing protein [Erythrobacter sp. 3-20A1M]
MGFKSRIPTNKIAPFREPPTAGAPAPTHVIADSGDTAECGVPAANFVRCFAKWRDEALKKPVFVTNHGRVTHALVGIDQFVSMTEAPTTAEVEANPFELAEWIDEAVIICDKHLVVQTMNRVASATCCISAPQCVGRNLYECLPQLRGTLYEVNLMRTVEANEPTSADIPSPLRQDGWLRLQTFPLHGCNVLMFRDITEEVERHRLADVKAALIEAMAVHNAIGYVRVGVSGMIERVDQPFCDLLGVPEERLCGARLVDLVSRETRVAFKTDLEEAMAGHGSRRVVARFLTNRGTTDDLLAAIVQLRGAYGAEGAVILLTSVNLASDRAPDGHIGWH